MQIVTLYLALLTVFRLSFGNQISLNGGQLLVDIINVTTTDITLSLSVRKSHFRLLLANGLQLDWGHQWIIMIVGTSVEGLWLILLCKDIKTQRLIVIMIWLLLIPQLQEVCKSLLLRDSLTLGTRRTRWFIWMLPNKWLGLWEAAQYLIMDQIMGSGASLLVWTQMGAWM